MKSLEDLKSILSRMETLEDDVTRCSEEVYVLTSRLRRLVERAENPVPSVSVGEK